MRRCECLHSISMLILALGLTACGREPSQVLQDELVTSAVHPFVAQYGGHCAGTSLRAPAAPLLRSRGDTLYFQGTTDGTDAGLWASDGTAAGTRLLVPSTTYRVGAATPFLREILPTNQGVFFAMDPPCIFPPPVDQRPLPPAPLWWTDRHGSAELLLPEHQVQGLVQSGDRLFFRAKGPAGRTGLWTLGLATRQPVQIGSFEYVTDIAPIGTQGVVFVDLRSGEDTTMCFSDGTQEGTHGLEDLCPFPGRLVSVGPRAYFVCGRDLAMTDGTPGGTQLVPGAPSQPTDIFSGLVSFNSKLAFFFRPVAADSAVELWLTDGTVTGTHALASFSVPPRKEAGTVSLVVADKLFFVVEDTLWRSDGTPAGTAVVTALPPVAASPDTTHAHQGGRFIATLGDRLLVVMNDAEPWQVWGMEATRVPLDPSVTSIGGIAATPSRVFYSAQVTTPPAGWLWLTSLRAWRLVATPFDGARPVRPVPL